MNPQASIVFFFAVLEVNLLKIKAILSIDHIPFLV